MQILLNFPAYKPESITTQRAIRLALKRAVVKWLSDQDTSSDKTRHLSLGIDVPLRGTTLQADVAAVRCDYVRTRLDDGTTSPLHAPVPFHSTVVICAAQREDCWPECTNAEQLIAEIAILKQQLADTEQHIRQTEPQLRDNNVLFAEFAHWNYAASQNQDYHRLKHQLEHLEHTLYKGSRLERLLNANIASQLLLAFPQNTLADTAAHGPWGLLEVNVNTLETSLRQQPATLAPPSCHLTSLALAIAEANTRHVADCLGLRLNDDKPAEILKLPRFRRNSKKQH